MRVLTTICFDGIPAIVVNWDELTDGDMSVLIESVALGLSADEIEAATWRDAADGERKRWQTAYDAEMDGAAEQGHSPEDFPFFSFDLRPFQQ